MNQNLLEVLRKSGLRATPQRIAICEFLTTTDTHPTVNDIFTNLKGKYPSLSLATIYNTLDILVGMGFVNVLGSLRDGKVHFDGNTEPHINIVCVQCHRVIDKHSDFIQHLDSEISQNTGYKLIGSRVLYYGVCQNCQSDN